MRRRGLATFIFSELEREIKQENVQRVSFHVYADNAPAIELYKKHGFATTNLVMSKALE